MTQLVYQPLSSGSKGNLTYLSSKDTHILIDCGLPLKHTLERLNAAHIDASKIDAILLTHEHSDHIRGLDVFARRYNTPVLCTNALALHLKNECGWDLNYKVFSKEDPFYYGSIHIDPIGISHDAVDPVAFVFTIQGHRIGHCTDLGFVSSLVAKKLEGCHILLLESNHDIGMVHSSTRPQVYKKRVLSRVGHLSNEASSELIAHLYHPGLKKLYLGHLSEECNHADKALHVHQGALEKIGQTLDIEIAYQHEISSRVDVDAHLVSY
jgi:phosphoribosyl 1,2-cyclic phosphodiesterase